MRLKPLFRKHSYCYHCWYCRTRKVTLHCTMLLVRNVTTCWRCCWSMELTWALLTTMDLTRFITQHCVAIQGESYSVSSAFSLYLLLYIFSLLTLLCWTCFRTCPSWKTSKCTTCIMCYRCRDCLAGCLTQPIDWSSAVLASALCRYCGYPWCHFPLLKSLITALISRCFISIACSISVALMDSVSDWFVS